MRFFILLLVLFSVAIGESLPTQSFATTQADPLVLSGQQAQTEPLEYSATTPLEDIEGPMELAQSIPWKVIVSAILIALVGGIVLLFIWKKLRKPKQISIAPAAKALLALQEFAHLKSEACGLLYMERISEILRIYIEERFHLHPTRQTTKEFLYSVSQPTTIQEIDTTLARYKDQLQNCLELSDMAKFAHCPPSYDGLDDIEKAIESFIQATDVGQENTGGVS